TAIPRWTWNALRPASYAAISTASPPLPTSPVRTARRPSSGSTACRALRGSISSVRSSIRAAACSAPAARPRRSWRRISASILMRSGCHENLLRRQIGADAGQQDRAEGQRPRAQGQGLRHHADERDADARASTRGAEAAVAGAHPVPAHAAVPQGREEMKRHEGRSMLVTGAAGAIGFATCEILAREGARVMLVDIDEAGLAKRVQQLKHAGHEAVGHV